MKTKHGILFGFVVLLLATMFTACPPDSEITPPELTGTVTITGTPTVGQTLTANTDSLDGTGTISYQWIRDTTDISEATSSTYTLVAADDGTAIKVQVSRAGYSGTVTSAATALVAADNLPALTGTVTITGTPKVGQILTANTDSLEGSGTISYQWIRDATDIDGATAVSYTLVAADEGAAIKVRVSRADNSGSITSAATSAVAGRTPEEILPTDWEGYNEAQWMAWFAANSGGDFTQEETIDLYEFLSEHFDDLTDGGRAAWDFILEFTIGREYSYLLLGDELTINIMRRGDGDPDYNEYTPDDLECDVFVLLIDENKGEFPQGKWTNKNGDVEYLLFKPDNLLTFYSVYNGSPIEYTYTIDIGAKKITVKWAD
jgi:hypothetical protein